MQQSSATPKNACSHSSSQYLLVSTVFGMVSSLRPTSFFNDFYTCFTKFLCSLALTVSSSARRERTRTYAHAY